MEVKMIEYKKKKKLFVDYRGAITDKHVLELLEKDIEFEKTKKRISVTCKYRWGSFISRIYGKSI